MDKDIPNLSNLTVASPCTALWSEMSGDEKARFCGDCKKHVYNLSEMSKKDAEALILEKEGKLCVRFFRRKDGTVLTDDCPVGLKAIRNLYRRTAACIGAGISLLLSLPVLSKEIKGDAVRQGEMVASPVNQDSKTGKPGKSSKMGNPSKQANDRPLQGDVSPGHATTGFAAPQPKVDPAAKPGQSNSKLPAMQGEAVPMMGAPAVIPQNTGNSNPPKSEVIMGKIQAPPSSENKPPKKPETNKSNKGK